MATQQYIANQADIEDGKYFYHNNDCQTPRLRECSDQSSENETSVSPTDPDLQVNQQLTELSTSTGQVSEIFVTATNGKTYMIDLTTLIIPPYIDPQCNIEGATFAFIKAYQQ